MRLRPIAMTLLAAAALTACGKKAEEAPAAPQALASAATTTAQEAPKRKAGLWEQTITAEDMTMTSRICTDEAYEQTASWTAGQSMPGACSENTVTPAAAGGWAFKSVCDMGPGGKTTTEGVASGDFSSRYEINATTVTSGAAVPQMNRTSQMAMVVEWKGPCPEGWAAGDMEMPGIGKISAGQMGRMADMAKAAK